MAESSAARDAAVRDLALVVADSIAAGAFDAAGRLSGRQWLLAYTDNAADEVGRVLSLGRLLALHPATRAAVESGRLSIGRAAVIAKAVTDQRRAHYERIEADLLDVFASAARTDDVDKLVKHWTSLVDQDTAGPPPELDQRLYLQNRLDGGASIVGELDAPTAHLLHTALDTYDTGPDPVLGPTPPRPLSRRRADALNTMARNALCALHDGNDEDGEHGDGNRAGADDEGERDGNRGDDEDGERATRATGSTDPTSSATPPAKRRRDLPVLRPTRAANMVIDLPSLAGRTGSDIEGIIATLDGRPLAIWAVEQLLCDSWIAAVVTDANGAVIDATERTAAFTDTQRRLIATRDRHCVFPACDAPPSWCDVHHLHWRSHGGGRTLTNGVLLCGRHHTLLHMRDERRRWKLEPNHHGGPGWHATSPTGRIWTGQPGGEPPPRSDHRHPPTADPPPATAA